MTERRRVFVAVAVLAALYVVVIALGDTRAWSGSDAGGKVATVRSMAEEGRWVPDVGYWAAEFDADGRYHSLYNTKRIGAHWVQVTSLPFAYAGIPLWRLGGPGALLALPMLGSLLGAVAARRLARAIGSGSGWPAFWLVGAASPLSFYAGDFWEHSAAVGLALFAAALALEDGGWRRALLAGLALGVAVVLRIEMAVYAAAFGLATLLVPTERRRWLAQPRAAVGLALGAAAPVVVNFGVERLVLGVTAGASRTGGAASGAGAEIGQRVHDGLLTTVGLFADERAGALVLGAVAVAVLAVARRYPVAWIAAAGLYVVRATQGLGFIPGALAAVPAAAGARPTSLRAHVVALTAVIAVPMVWLVQWRGQLLPQWGGRYLLLTGALLLVVASLDWRPIAPAVVLTVAGRDVRDALARRPHPPVRPRAGCGHRRAARDGGGVDQRAPRP